MHTKNGHLRLEYDTRNIIQHIAHNYPIKDYKKIFALIKLTWYDEKSKLTGLNMVFDTDHKTIDEIIYSVKDAKLKHLLQNNTGYVNFYRSYRNTSYKWAYKNKKNLIKIYTLAQNIKNDNDIIRITKVIEKLPKIPRADDPKIEMASDSLLTPLLACIDPTGRFPIVNKNHTVTELHKKMGITKTSLSEKVSELLKIMNENKIKNSLYLDVYGKEAIKKKIRKIEAESKKTSQKLLPKDDSDIKYILSEKRKTVVQKHRKLEQILISFCQKKGITVEEGTCFDLKYDALLKNYRPNRNLLIEIKGSSKIPEIRLALGQILDYGYDFRNDHTDLAILLPEKPEDKYLQIAKEVNVNVLWINGKTISGTIKI